MSLLARLQGYQVSEMTARPSVAGKLTRVVGLMSAHTSLPPFLAKG